MRGGMLRYYGCTALYACDDTVSLRMVEIPGENVGSGRRGCGRVHCSTDLPDRMVTGWYRRAGCRMFLWSGYGCSDYMSMLPTTCLCAYGYTSSHPNLSEPCTIPPPPSASTCDRATPALVRFRRTLHVAPLSTDVRWPTDRTRGGLCGVGARVGTSKPTSPLGRRRRYLAPRWVFDTEKYAHRLAAASRPARPDLGRSGRVSFQTIMVKQSWSGPASVRVAV
jgi:hypothetical protein